MAAGRQAEEEQMITADQVKPARKLLGWSQVKLAQEADISQKTLANFESGQRVKSDREIRVIHNALERAGVEFPESDPVRMRKVK
jgi:transcriptional regulator with XRE-family HTH domain